jgi:hypothetical protein
MPRSTEAARRGHLGVGPDAGRHHDHVALDDPAAGQLHPGHRVLAEDLGGRRADQHLDARPLLDRTLQGVLCE